MLLPVAADASVPVYTLEQTSRTGARHFEITHHHGLAQHQKDLFFRPHRKDFYLLAFLRSGSGRHWVDTVAYTLKPDSLYFSAPQQVFLKEDGVFEAIALSFTPEFLGLEEKGLLEALPILQNRRNAHELPLAPAECAFVDDLCQKLLAEFQHDQSWRNSMLLAYLRVLLIYLSRLYTERYPDAGQAVDRTLFRRFQELVGVHFAESHEVTAYASQLHVSAGHLGERIKAETGKTPLEHIHDRLLLEAKRLLFHTEASAKEIAFELGFEEASYFNRFFKRLTGATPLGYRHAIREMYQ